MSENLSNGTDVLSATEELKLLFQEIKKDLPEDWVIKYLERFAVGMPIKSIVKLRWVLTNINRNVKPVAPSPSILSNIKLLMKESGIEKSEIVKSQESITV